MKKLLVIALMLSFGYGLFAQVGAYAGLNFAYNSTWLINQQVFDDGPGQDIEPSFSYYYGLVAGYKFTDVVGIEVDVNFGNIVQKYTGSLNYFGTSNYNDYKSRIDMKTIDIPILAKFGEKSYFEVGPVVQLINKVNYTMSFDDSNVLFPYWYKDVIMPANIVPDGNKNVSEKFLKTGFGVAMGFGSDISLIDESLMLNIGVRFQYTITDLEGVNGLGLTVDSPYVPEKHNNVREKDRFSSHPLFGGFKIGLKYCF